jgi:hypothetical protein
LVSTVFTPTAECYRTALILAEDLETTRIHRVAGLAGARPAWVTTRPFRAPTIPSRLWG